jgi:ribosomal protein S12 methylthiotransferase accessory factor YcaO
MRNLSELQANADQHTMLEMLDQWISKSDNDDLKQFRDALLRTVFYVNSLEMDRQTFDALIDQYKNDRLRAVQRARKADETIAEQDAQIKKMKQSLKAFGL